MLFETPDDIYNSYKRFLRKGEYKRSYRCLERLLRQFPDDIGLLEEVVNLCVLTWERPRVGRKWLDKLIKIRESWMDYILLGHIEAEVGNICRAKECLERARKLQKVQPQLKGGESPRKVFFKLVSVIKYMESSSFAKVKFLIPEEGSATLKKGGAWNRSQKKLKGADGLILPQRKGSTSQKAPGKIQTRRLKPSDEAKIKQPPTKINIPTYNIPIKIEPISIKVITSFLESGKSTLKNSRLLIDYTHLTLQSGFDELLCLNAIADVEKYWYQIETVKKVLKYFHGRVLLCDEVGLGKTIEAGMLVKEYLMRGMAKNVLILTPAPLVSQWKEEMSGKFGIDFLTTDDNEFVKDSADFWKQRFIIASINTAKSSKNMGIVTEQLYDLVIVDEAHHLRNRTTLAWKLVNHIKKRFIFLLTATPVQNHLIELFNLITILKPGQFKTEKLFKKEYVQKGNPRAPANKERLRELLRDVMVRNTRSAIDLKLPQRFAQTIRVQPTEDEREFYSTLNDYLRKYDFKKPMINLMLREAGSSLLALRATLLNMKSNDGTSDILSTIDRLGDFSKGKALMDILRNNPNEKKVVFTQYIKSADYITTLLARSGIFYSTFRGDMSLKEKDAAISRFKKDIPVLVSTESGGEGRNMQFCNTIINFDLPWNPMRIEQRIGRLHRIGQKRDVFIFNLSTKGTIEDYVIEILDNKINMFEMVIGEIEPILGYIGEDKGFEDMIMDIWFNSNNADDLEKGFEQFGKDLMNVKNKYIKAKTLDEKLFGEDYET